MIRDERLRDTHRRAAARGYQLVFWLLLIDLNYRLFWLKESPREHWDLAAICFAGAFLVFGSIVFGGGFSGDYRVLKRVVPTVFIGVNVISALRADELTVGFVVRGMLASALALAVFAGMVVAVTRLWERRRGLQSTDPVA